MTGAGAGAVARRGARREEISPFEWVVAALGLLLVLATVGFVVLDAIRTDAGPPRLTVRADSVVSLGDAGWLVPFTARNDAHVTAAGVTIVGELHDAAGVETSRTELDYVPGRSERQGGLLFRRDPRQGVVRVRAEGYQDP